MEGRSQKKWKTLRKIASPQPESESEAKDVRDIAVEEKEVESPLLPDVTPEGPVRILVAHPVASTTRLIRETLESFTDAEVETTSSSLRAFELALQRSYQLFFFGMQIGELEGPLLYELISKACSCGRGPKQLAPGVVFVREKDDAKLPKELERDVRVKDVISKPIRIDRLLKTVKSIVEVKDPTAG